MYVIWRAGGYSLARRFARNSPGAEDKLSFNYIQPQIVFLLSAKPTAIPRYQARSLSEAFTRRCCGKIYLCARA
jgi:hypothetical protein